MRTFEQTHRWLTFGVDLNRIDASLWMQLGEARSKIEHIGGSLLRPDVAEQMHWLFLAKGALATTAIEGNTLSEQQALDVIKGQSTLPPSQEYLAQEIRNVVAACNEIAESVIAGRSTEITSAKISHYNELVLTGLELDEGVEPGEIRTHSVTVGGRYRGAPAEDCEYLLERLSSWLNSDEFNPPRADWVIPFAVLKAILAHLYLAWIHPFGDGNGRTARLLELKILVAAGVPTPAAHLLSNHYNQTRSEYYRQLAAASASGGDVVPFIRYAVEGFVEGLRFQLALIKEQQFDDRWEQFVYESFGEATSPTERRRRQLVLDLSNASAPVRRAAFPLLSPALAGAYAQKTTKTLSRDVNALIGMNLIRRVGNGYVPNKEQILAFLPESAPTPAETDASS